MRLGPRLGAFNFDEKSVIDLQIDPERGWKDLAFKFNVDRPLAIDLIPHLDELPGQNCFINALKQAWAEISVNSHCNINDVAANCINVSQPSLRVSASPREP